LPFQYHLQVFQNELLLAYYLDPDSTELPHDEPGSRSDQIQ
jgi:hypothetical protein